MNSSKLTWLLSLGISVTLLAWRLTDYIDEKTSDSIHMTRAGLEIQGKLADELQLLIILLCALLAIVSSIKLYRLRNS